MQMYLQFGHGMMEHARKLLTNWGGGGVILSPRDLNEGQLQTVSRNTLDLNAEPLLDPQCYARDADHHRLTAHRYWQIYQNQTTTSLLQRNGAAELLEAIADLNGSLGISRHILPGIMANPITDDWFTLHENIIAEASTHFNGQPILATVALSCNSLSDENQVEAIIDRAANWQVNGCYVVAETPSAYLVEDPNWLANLLILCSGLRLQNKDVIVGYCHHQMLCLAAANVNTIASGTWRNVRSFPIEKFYEDEGKIIQRAIWYYCPHALSEYKLPFLDIAQRLGVLDRLRSDPLLGSTYADELFAGVRPSTIAWGEQRAFRHYLTCLHAQCAVARMSSFEDTIAAHNQLLDIAGQNLAQFINNGIFGQDREFNDYIDVSRSALILFQRARGARLRRTW